MRAGDYATRFAQHPNDVLPFQVYESVSNGRSRFRGAQFCQWRSQHRSITENHRSFHEVFHSSPRTRKGSGEGEGALLSSAPVSRPGRQAAFPRWPTSQIFIFSGCSRAQDLDGYLLAFEIPNWTRTLTCRKSVANAVQ